MMLNRGSSVSTFFAAMMDSIAATVDLMNNAGEKHVYTQAQHNTCEAKSTTTKHVMGPSMLECKDEDDTVTNDVGPWGEAI